MEKKCVFVLAMVVLLVAILAKAEIRYNVTDLGPGSASSINNNGQIVGWSGVRATLFDSSGAGNNIDLGTLGGDQSMAWSISNNGQIVGVAAGWWHHATLFDPAGNGNNLDLGDGVARSINSNGQIVGSNYYMAAALFGGGAAYGDGSGNATVFDPSGAGNNIDLGTLPSYNYFSLALSINNDGQIVGFASNGPPGWSGHATVFDPTGDGNNIDLGTLGGDFSAAHSINNNGEIVGWAQNSLGRLRATLFDPNGNGNNTDLGTIPGYESSVAFSINNNGQIVGSTTSVYFPPPPGGPAAHAILFTTNGTGDPIDLNTLIDPSCGWTLTEARSINDSGWIVGHGINPEGDTHAYLLTPEPADPVELLMELAQNVIALNLQQGISNSLDGKLDAALHALEDINENNDVAAINTLQAFINAVEAQRGNKISEADADALIADVLEIIDLLIAE